MDESVSDFVAGRIEATLMSRAGDRVYDWFDPRTPTIPLQVAPSTADMKVRAYWCQWRWDYGSPHFNWPRPVILTTGGLWKNPPPVKPLHEQAPERPSSVWMR